MKNRIEITFPEQPAAADLGDRLVTLCDGRPGVRSTMQVEISEPGQEPTLSPSHGGRVGERGREVAPADCTGPPLPSDGRGAGGEGSPSIKPTLDSQPSTPDSLARHSEATAAQPILDFIASDETLDRCDEVILAGGWRLDAYRRNPVFQNAHQYGDIIFTLGKALITEVRSSGLSTLNSSASANSYGATAPKRSEGGQPSTHLFQRVQFATDANPMARIAYALYKGKFLNAVSVGFIPLRWVNAEGTEQGKIPNPKIQIAEEEPLSPSLSPSDGEKERGGSQRSTNFRRRYLEQELIEVSAVGIPANPNALQLGLKAGAIQKSDLRDLLELLRTVLSSPCDAQSSPVQSSEQDFQLLLTLARDVRQVMKRG